MSITETAMAFFDACETGKGGEGCKDYCQEGATFSCQADALAEITTVEGYADWMKGLLTLTPDGNYELKSFATDTERGRVCAIGSFTALTPAKAARSRRPARKWQPIMSMIWNSTEAKFAT